MKIICSGRCTGKTTRLIKESNKTGQYILVSNKIQADVVAKLARKLELNIPYPITVHEMMNNRVGGIVKRRGILVDEAQYILEKVLDSKINVMTINAEEIDDEINSKRYKVTDMNSFQMLGKYVEDPKEVRWISEGDLNHLHYDYEFTEQEINEIDPRYMAFATKVDAE